MNQRDNVADQLKELLHIYEFSMDTLSKYLQLSVEQIFIKHLSGAKHLLVQVVKYKRKDVLIGWIDMPEEK